MYVPVSIKSDKVRSSAMEFEFSSKKGLFIEYHACFLLDCGFLCRFMCFENITKKMKNCFIEYS